MGESAGLDVGERVRDHIFHTTAISAYERYFYSSFKKKIHYGD
jgi:hypothetical protein